MSASGTKWTIKKQTFRRSLDHLLRAPDERIWDVEAERLGGLEVDVEFEFRALPDRQFTRLFAFENAGGVGAGETVTI